MLKIDPASPVPIWRQIEEGVTNLVTAGALSPESPVPSVRELARELRVNPLTVQKAYRRLIDLGVLQVRRGEGTYVASEPPRLAPGERRDKLREGALRFASLGRSLGADLDECAEQLGEAWQELENPREEIPKS